MKIILWAEVIEGYKEPDTWQSGELWYLDDVPWTAVPREDDNVVIGESSENDDHEGIVERVERVFWHDDGKVDVECGKVFTCGISLADFEALLTRRGWRR